MTGKFHLNGEAESEKSSQKKRHVKTLWILGINEWESIKKKKKAFQAEETKYRGSEGRDSCLAPGLVPVWTLVVERRRWAEAGQVLRGRRSVFILGAKAG